MERFESLCRSLGTGQYKLSVEVAIMARILARIAQVPDSEIRAIQTDCAQEVKRLGRAPTFLQSPRRERDGLMADDSALLPGRRPGGRRSHVKANDNFLLTVPYLSGYSASKSVLCVAKEGGGTHERLHEGPAPAVLLGTGASQPLYSPKVNGKRMAPTSPSIQRRCARRSWPG